MSMDPRFIAVEAYVQSFRTGEASAAERAARYLADDVTLVAGQLEVKGHAGVLDRISGQWPQTNVFMQGVWSEPVEQDGRIAIGAEFPNMGAALASVMLAFSFDASGKIARVDQENVAAPMTVVDKLPQFVKSLVDNALKNSTVMSLTYVDDSGAPSMSLRGGIQTYSDTELCLWIRKSVGGLAEVARRHGPVALMYRDSRVRTTLNFRGRIRLESSEEIRSLVFDRMPEVEQRHDLQHKGEAAVIEVEQLVGATTRGNIKFERAAAQ